MGSRTRIAAAACLVASGLVVGGPAVATALADPAPAGSEDSADRTASAAAQSPSGAPAGRRDDAADGEGAGEAEADEAGGADEAEAEADDEGEDLSGRDVSDDPQGRAEQDGHGDLDEAVGSTPASTDVGALADEKWPCCAEGDDNCGPGGWPWPWPQPEPEPVEDSTGSDGDYGGGLPAAPPVLRPPLGGAQPPEIVPPIEELPDPDVVDVVPGVGIPAAGAPVSAPLVVAVPVAVGAPVPAAAPAAGGGVAGLPAAPRQATAAAPRARQPEPAAAGSNAAVPAASYRVGYAEYLRTAGVSQIAALALPGLAGILVLTGAGGLVGYRQAKAGHVVRPNGVARFMNPPGS